MYPDDWEWSFAQGLKEIWWEMVELASQGLDKLKKPKKMKDKEHIMVVVPTRNRWVTESIACFFAHAAHKNYDDNFPYAFTVSTLGEIEGYAAVRNMAVKRFLESPCERLWFIDNDTILPEDIFSLPYIDGDIVTLPYPFVGTMTPAIVNYKDIDDFDKGMLDVKPDVYGLADVNGTGMGCTLIRRKVLEDERMRYPTTYVSGDGKQMDQADDPNAAPPIFKFLRKPDGSWDLGEDYDFCIRAKRLRYSIKIRMTSICGHLKTIDLNDAFNRTLRAVSEEREDTKTYHVATGMAL